MKTRARRISRNKPSTQIQSEPEILESSSPKKPTLTVISHEDETAKPAAVRPKVNTYPKRIKEAVRVEMRAANSNLPSEVDLPGALDLDSAEDKTAQAEMNQPAGTRFDWSFTIWLVALVVAVNLALLVLVGSPSKSASDKASSAMTTASGEAGVIVSAPIVEEPASAVVVKPVAAVEPKTASATLPTPVAAIAAPAPVVAAPKKVMAAQPVVSKPAKPAADLLSIINQN